MKVKIKDIVYDAEEEPIMIILTKADKKNIINMLPAATKYCSYPDTYDLKTIKEFMNNEEASKI